MKRARVQSCCLEVLSEVMPLRYGYKAMTTVATRTANPTISPSGAPVSGPL